MLQFDEAWMLAVVLLWSRLGALLAFSPLSSSAKAPTTFWVLFSLAMAGLLVSSLGLRASFPLTLGHFVLAMMGEVALGALLGLSLQCAFAAFVMAGRVLDVQMGFGMGSVLDPVTRSNAPVMGVALAMLGMALFFTTEGHHALMRGVAYSVSSVPPGMAWELPTPALLLRPIGAMFSAGVVVIAPVLFLLLMLELVLGVASRVLPQMNVLFVGMPAKILAGLVAMALAAPVIGPAMRRTYSAIFEFWGLVLP